MRLTDEQIMEAWNDAPHNGSFHDTLVATVRRCLALAALPDEQKEYNDRERRGFEVSQPGELPK